MAFKQRRESRASVFRKAGFLPFEARALSEVPSLSLPYVKDMLRERKKLISDFTKHAKQIGMTQTQFEKEYRDYIRYLYNEKGWVVQKDAIKRKKSVGRPDPWQLLKAYRDRSIAKGEYVFNPHWKKKEEKRHYRELHPEKIKAQKRRYLERQRAKKEKEE